MKEAFAVRLPTLAKFWWTVFHIVYCNVSVRKLWNTVTFSEDMAKKLDQIWWTVFHLVHGNVSVRKLWNTVTFSEDITKKLDRPCGLLVRVPGYRFRGPGFILGTSRFSEK
jgi:hypothetical protein